MIERFAGQDRHAALIEALRGQMIVQGNADVAERLSAAATLAEFQLGELIISQDGGDTDIYFILTGRASVVVHGREVAVRAAGVHVGEMVAIDPRARRCASVVALETTVVAKVSEASLTAIAKDHPYLWRRIALELGDRRRTTESSPRLIHWLVQGSNSCREGCSLGI